MSGVAIQHRSVPVADLSRVVQHDYLSGKILGSSGRLVLGVTGDVAATQLLDGDVLDVEANVVAGHGFGECLVVHLHGLDLGGQSCRGEGHDHARLEDAGLDSAHRHSSNATDLVDVLEKKLSVALDPTKERFVLT